MYADGALGSRGAALLAPYSDDPSNVGLIVTPQERIETVARSAFRTGISDLRSRNRRSRQPDGLGRVPNGAAGIGPGADLRPRIEHAQVIAREDVPRLAKLGVIVSMQAAHAISERRGLGASRAATIRDAYAWRAVLDSGSIVANGTDAPVEPVSTARTFHAPFAGGIASAQSA